MCLGSIELLTETYDLDGARVGTLAGGSTVSLAFLPEARAGSYVLVHLGIPVEVLDPRDAREALGLRERARSSKGGRRR
jgi:hydrogenase maturation factor